MRKETNIRRPRRRFSIAVLIGSCLTSTTLVHGVVVEFIPEDRDSHLASMEDTGTVQPNIVTLVTATNGTWIGNSAGTQNWSDTTKWSGGVVASGSGAIADFTSLDITGARNVTIDTTPTIGILNIGDTNGTHKYTFTGVSFGAPLTFQNSGSNAQLNQTATSAGDEFNVRISLKSSLDITNASSATLTFSGGIYSEPGFGPQTITTSTGNVLFTLPITGEIAVVQNGPGNLTFNSTNNTYSGGTTISGGKIILLGASLGTGPLTLSGGTLVSTASSLPNDVVLTANSALTTTSSGATVALSFGGTLTGTGGTLTIRNDASSTTGLFDVRFSGGDYTMTRPIVIDNGSGGGTAQLSDFNTSGSTHTYSGVISGNGSYSRSVSSGNGGVTIFLAENTYTGTTTVNNGTLQLGNGGTTGSLSPSSAIQINAGGTLGFFHTSGADFVQGTNFSSTAITGAGKIVKEGISSLTFNVANTFSGGLTIIGGTVIATADGALGTGNVSLISGYGVVLTLQGITNALSDTGTLTVALDSTVNLNYTGSDVVSGLVVGGTSYGPGTYGSGDFTQFMGPGTITVVPEPATVAMMVLGAGLLMGAQRFRRKLR